MLSDVPLSKIVKVISGDNVSRGSKIMLRYGPDVLKAEIIGVNGMYLWTLLTLHYRLFI